MRKFGLLFYSFSFAVHVTLIIILGVLFSLWGEINEIFYRLLTKNWNYSLILFFTAIVSGIYSGCLILLKKKSSMASKFSQIILSFLLPLLSFIFDTVILLLTLVSGAGHLKLIFYILDFLFPILMILGLITLGLIIPRVISFLKNVLLKSRNNSTTNKKLFGLRGFSGVSATSLVILLYISVLIIPLMIHPLSIYTETIPEKPLIIAHRGTAHISPENTLEAVECASEIGADGWEVDVRISIDGVFFLMHDTNLKRTTNVASIFPERIDEDASSFTMAELLQLDAGSWFVDRDPFGTIRSGRVDSEAADSYLGARIPLLDEILNYTVDNLHWIDIDMKKPSTYHPFASQYEDLLLDKLNLYNLTKSVIVNSFKPAAGNFTHLLSPGDYSIGEMSGIGAEMIDEKYWVPNGKIGEYNDANLPIMVGVLDSRVRFSQVWSLGVQMVLTDDPDVFIKMTVPLRIMKNSIFIPLWIGLSLISYGGGFSFFIYKEKQKKVKTELK